MPSEEIAENLLTEEGVSATSGSVFGKTKKAILIFPMQRVLKLYQRGQKD
jgi:aspartate/methionine/tyrosine aminotransferase